MKYKNYTEELFKTFNDEDNRKKVAEYKTNDLNLVGIGLIGKKNHVSKLAMKVHRNLAGSTSDFLVCHRLKI